MSIPVHCRECQFRFRVGDEFAGRPGRCPECDSILQVPQLDSDPWGSRDDREDGIAPNRRSRPRPLDDDDIDRPRTSRRRERDRDFEREPSFDPVARAERWKRVDSGLWSILAAIILYVISQIIQTIFVFSKGIEHAKNGNIDSGDQAIMVFGLIGFLSSAVFWLIGRTRINAVPYRPAKGGATGALILTWLTVLGVFGFVICLGIAVVIIINQGPNPEAVGFITFAGLCVMGAATCGVVAEYSGNYSVKKIASGLRASSAEGWSTFAMIWLSVLSVAMVAGCCVLFAVAVENGKKRQQQLQQNPNAFPNWKPKNPPVPPPKIVKIDEKGDGLLQVPDEAAPAPNGPNNGPNGPNANPQNNPFDDDKMTEEDRLIVQMIFLGCILSYLFVITISIVKTRSAVKAEIARLLPVHPDDMH
jgi:hypothetical protein